MKLNGSRGRSIWVAAAAAALLLGVGAAVGTEAPRADLIWVPVQAADASDRAYEAVAIQLIDNATSSIALGMYYLKEGKDDRHPISRLLRDLLEAAQRGVQVEVYLNSKFSAEAIARLDTPWLNRLRAAGATVALFPPDRRWHGKLLIVDERYILEGSSNWSVEAIRTNGESNTVMDSHSLARQKLEHLQAWGTTASAPLPDPVVEPDWPDTVAFPSVWLARGGVLPLLVTRHDDRGADAWLLLIRRAAVEAEPEFSVDFRILSKELALPAAWSNVRQRQEILQVLNRLEARTGTLEFRLIGYGQDAWVRLAFPEGPRVTLPMTLLTPDRLARQSGGATYLALLDVALREEGKVGIQDMTLPALKERTGLSISLLSRARRELVEMGTFSGAPDPNE